MTIIKYLISKHYDSKLPRGLNDINNILNNYDFTPKDKQTFTRQYNQAVDDVDKYFEQYQTHTKQLNGVLDSFYQYLKTSSNDWYYRTNRTYCFEIECFAYFFLIFARTPLIFIGTFFVCGLISNLMLFVHGRTTDKSGQWLSDQSLLALHIIQSVIDKRTDQSDLVNSHVDKYFLQVRHHFSFGSFVTTMFLHQRISTNRNLWLVNDYIKDNRLNKIDDEDELITYANDYSAFLSANHMSSKDVENDLKLFPKVVNLINSLNTQIKYNTFTLWISGYILFLLRYHPFRNDAIITLCILSALSLLIQFLSIKHVGFYPTINYIRIKVLNDELQQKEGSLNDTHQSPNRPEDFKEESTS